MLFPDDHVLLQEFELAVASDMQMNERGERTFEAKTVAETKASILELIGSIRGVLFKQRTEVARLGAVAERLERELFSNRRLMEGADAGFISLRAEAERLRGEREWQYDMNMDLIQKVAKLEQERDEARQQQESAINVMDEALTSQGEWMRQFHALQNEANAEFERLRIDLATAHARGRAEGREEAAKQVCRGCGLGWPWQPVGEEFHVCPQGWGDKFYKCDALAIRSLAGPGTEGA